METAAEPPARTPHPQRKHDWPAVAAAARLAAGTDEPWVLVGHSVHRSHAQLIKRGERPAFKDPDGKVRFETATRGSGLYASLWVRYVP